MKTGGHPVTRMTTRSLAPASARRVPVPRALVCPECNPWRDKRRVRRRHADASLYEPVPGRDLVVAERPLPVVRRHSSRPRPP